ncbi:aspartate dehydrogenase [Nitratireductor rhodophyticola]|uniref:aspartate dehydrogenase n=1 Tax=Nitratireductor rhodophyticola TaxID=2854036 RepID=UPI003009215B
MSEFDAKPRSPLRIVLIGWGAIARRVATLLQQRDRRDISIVAVAVRDTSAPRDGLPSGAPLIASPSDLENIECDLVLEAAGRDSVEPWCTAALTCGCDFVVSSTSAFCDEALLQRLKTLAEKRGCQMIVPPGAIGGIDVLSAASVLQLERVEHVIIKPPAAWFDTPAEAVIDFDAVRKPTVIFSGSAQKAARAFPQNANVAAISALAGIGLEHTQVTLIADPGVSRNGHRIVASGLFGRLEMSIENEPLATNPKSSELTALSLIRVLENRLEPLVL